MLEMMAPARIRRTRSADRGSKRKRRTNEVNDHRHDEDREQVVA
jgi:hypothetical protein